jgi:NAD(P)-dependent dehydrogenase (short-subunit alcohol dehydrogenase family)
MMARILVTGSADGLGQMAAQRLAASNHEVVLHARNTDRAHQAIEALPSARHVVVGDLSSIAETRALADQANAVGPFDAVIHNAGVGYREPRTETVDGLEHVYLSSGMHRGGDPNLGDLLWRDRRWNGSQAYADSKLFDVVLAFAVARRWPHVLSNALEPGWVPTKMGGPNAPDDMAQAPETQVWLAVSDDLRATVTGRYFYHKSLRDTHPAASDIQVQDGLLRACEEFTGVTLASANSRSESSR